VSGQDHGSGRALEAGNRDRSVRDAEGNIVPGLFSLCWDPVVAGNNIIISSYRM
jgi:hypothetical protein